jgi:hypothetical protein
MEGKDYKYDVFISYSTVDQKVAEGLCGYLEQGYQYRCFVAYRDVPPSNVWARDIAEAIDSSAMMVVVFSESFNVSSQTDREIELASENKIPILTFKLSNASMTGAKKYYLKNLNWIDAFPYPETYFGKLKDTVDKLLNRDSKRERRQTEESERLRREREEKERMIREDEGRKRGKNVELLIKDRGMVPMAKSMTHENMSNLPNLKVKCNLDSELFIDGKYVGNLDANEMMRVPLAEGEYILRVQGVEYFLVTETPEHIINESCDFIEEKVLMPNNDYIFEVNLLNVREKRLERERKESSKQLRKLVKIEKIRRIKLKIDKIEDWILSWWVVLLLLLSFGGWFIYLIIVIIAVYFFETKAEGLWVWIGWMIFLPAGLWTIAMGIIVLLRSIIDKIDKKLKSTS